MVLNGNQIAIIWYVNYLNISNIDAYEVTELIGWTRGIYGSHRKGYRGKKHDYLGIDLDFSVGVHGSVKITY